MPRTPDVAATPSTPPFASTAGVVVVATDATHDSDGAVRVGLALARRDNVTVDLFSVVEPMPLYDHDGVPLPDVEHLMTLARESREAAILDQRDRTHPGIREWPHTVEIGPRVDRIVARALRDDASLILLGLGAHGVGARLRQRETALRVIRAARKPVLAVPSHGWGVPHSALAALDFTASSEDAARAAMTLLGGEGTLYLAHVTPRVPIPQGDPRSWEEITRGAVLPRLEAVARRLAPPPGIQIEYVVLHGDPAHELVATAEEFHIDMIAAGMHGRTALGRMVLGSVSTKLVRTAACWVLVAPPHEEGASRPDASGGPNHWS